jgi:hypothetical protein
MKLLTAGGLLFSAVTA